MNEAFSSPSAGGRYEATPRTSGPWDPAHQHAGPPSALLLGALERQSAREELVGARITVEILGPVPIGALVVRTAVERPGRPWSCWGFGSNRALDDRSPALLLERLER